MFCSRESSTCGDPSDPGLKHLKGGNSASSSAPESLLHVGDRWCFVRRPAARGCNPHSAVCAAQQLQQTEVPSTSDSWHESYC